MRYLGGLRWAQSGMQRTIQGSTYELFGSTYRQEKSRKHQARASKFVFFFAPLLQLVLVVALILVTLWKKDSVISQPPLKKKKKIYIYIESL